MAGTVVVFDFDRTIIDDDSDRWVVTEMGLAQIFNELRSTLPWTSLMDRMMKELHSQGISAKNIAECMKRTLLHPSIIAAIKSAHALGCDLRIISDANKFFIETILEHHGILGCFSQVYTNPTFLDVEGRLRIIPFHDSNMPPHSCHLCPSNMCKVGLVIDQIRGSLPEKKRRFIYLGDGSGDYCPTLKLERGDFVMPRKNYPLWNRICNNPELVNAEVHEWSSGEELESILLNLIKKVTVVEDTTSDSCSMNSSECFERVQFSGQDALSQTLPLPLQIVIQHQDIRLKVMVPSWGLGKKNAIAGIRIGTCIQVFERDTSHQPFVAELLVPPPKDQIKVLVIRKLCSPT
ncbi:thiamine phosphate phosphatase-like protein [Senna tora]|uniref:Thiamine phosphate phosphatase-like protein n=1 Tax=Senna tora TaxID=362788 RepID=A0A834WKT8_9FABA|nr:thiamine phosphate phosphatase-like protein [Senna tora]